MSDDANENRLPPPAFPPGMRRRARWPDSSERAARTEAEADGFISPDEPLPEREVSSSTALGEAYISPDEPIPERKIELAEPFRDLAPVDPDDEGEVVGMDLDPHLHAEEVVSGGDPHVMEVIVAVAKLAEALKLRGESGLRSEPDMGRFEATLRAYCVGYLAGRRAEEPPPPEIEEALPTDA